MRGEGVGVGSAGSGGEAACVGGRRVPVSKRRNGGGLEAGALGQSAVTWAWHRAGDREGNRKVLRRFTNVVRGDMVHKGTAEIVSFASCRSLSRTRPSAALVLRHG